MSAPVDELLSAARQIADRAGGLPSVRQLKKELRIGYDRARALRDEITEDQSEIAEDRYEITEDHVENTWSPSAEPVPAPVPRMALPTVSDTGDHALPEVTPGSPRDRVVPGQDRVPQRRGARSWPVLVLALPASVAIWSGWVGLGERAGFGVVHPLPGIWDEARLNTAITLPVGMEAYAAYALWAWLNPALPSPARRFAKWSSLISLTLGAAGQVAFHLMSAWGIETAPWPITTAVACLPVAVLGMGAALAHLIHINERG